MPSCPTCGADYDTERGVRIHHTKAHDTPHPDTTTTCPECGDEFTTSPSDDQTFCSRECAVAGADYATGERHGRWTGTVALVCEECGDEYERPPSAAEGSRFCSRECQAAWQSDAFGGDDWHLTGTTGPAHPKYTGHEDYYGENWAEQRQKALDRDGNECRICGMGVDEHLERHGCELHVHHIRPIGSYDTPEAANELSNLVTLCRACHVKWEGIPVMPR